MEHILTDREVITVRLSGEIDHHSAQYWRSTIDTYIQSVTCRLLRLDFSGVTFMDSSGVGLIMGRYRLMQQLGGAVELVGVSPKIQMMLHLAGIDRLNIMKGEAPDESHE